MGFRHSLSLMFAMLATPLSAQCPDLALVLAVDSSGSIDAKEFDLQRAGYAAAFTDPQVLAALQSAGVVDVALVLWGDTEMPAQVFPWHRITTAADADLFAASVLSAPAVSPAILASALAWMPHLICWRHPAIVPPARSSMSRVMGAKR